MKKVIVLLAVIACLGSLAWVLVGDENAIQNLQTLKDRTGKVFFTPTPTIAMTDDIGSAENPSESDDMVPVTKGGIPLADEITHNPTITYTSKGFEPAIVTVVVGTTVRFQSKNTDTMQIFSDVHPDHTILPDLKQPQKGSTYDYTFQRVGRWTFHSEDNPSVDGVVIVEVR